MAGIDYVATNFSMIEGWVHTFGVKPRVGLTIQTIAQQALDLYSGASWQDFSEEQTFSATGVTLAVSPKRPWSGLVGAAYRLDGGPLAGFSLTAEGEVGHRKGVILSVRYQFDTSLFQGLGRTS